MLEGLPDEIIITICKKLDFKSLSNLYKASVRIQSVITLYNVVKECNISLSTMGSICTLQSDFFRDISHNLSNLNLCGVFDLCKSTLIPIMTKLKKLETLDVSYTPISIIDFVDIYNVCPTIKDITIIFYFGEKYSDSVPQTTLLECQKIFMQLECVHFVGNDSNLLYSDIAIFILALANLKKVQYTISEQDNNFYDYMELASKLQLSFDFFSLCIPFLYTFSNIEVYSPFCVLDFELYEYFVLHLYRPPYILSATEIFRNFFQERFNLQYDNDASDVFVDGNVCVMLWKRDSNIFNDTFFDLLYDKIKIHFIYYHCDDDWDPLTVLKYKRFCIKPNQTESTGIDSDGQLSFKKKRIVLPNYVLNYDEEFKDKHEFNLYLTFSNHINAAITLPSNSEYLQKITYLNLNGPVQYSTDFFHILFKSCTKLITLNIEVTNMSTSMVSRSVPLSRTIKNLRIVGKGIDLDSAIVSLSQCPSLENVHIGDTSTDELSIFDATTMIQNCSDLYCVCIYKPGISDSEMSRQLTIINEARIKCNKMYIYFKVMKSEIDLQYVSNPYIDVFRLFSPISD